MVASLYVRSYFDHLKMWYKDQGFEFDNFNDVVDDLFYVPKNNAEHMVDNLARYALSKSKKIQGEPFIYLGWNRSVVKFLEGTRNHQMHRRLQTEDARITKVFRDTQFDIATFILTNMGNTAEDLEEIFNAVIHPKSEYTVNMGSVYIVDYPEFSVNTQHSGGVTSNPMLDVGNTWALHFNVKITGPSIEFNEKQMAAAKSLSVSLYNLVTGQLLDVITN